MDPISFFKAAFPHLFGFKAGLGEIEEILGSSGGRWRIEKDVMKKQGCHPILSCQ